MNGVITEINGCLDPSYAEFSRKLIPNIPKENILGLRAPDGRRIAKKYANNPTGEEFLSSLPHISHDESMVHAYMLGYLKCDAEELLSKVNAFLPFVDNWAVCDSLCASLKRLFKDTAIAKPFIERCFRSEHTYTVRFGIVSLLDYYVSKENMDFIFSLILSVKSDKYYINMALAWLVCECLAKEYEDTLPIIKERLLCPFVHNKSIQKARESYRISEERKAELYELRRNKI